MTRVEEYYKDMERVWSAIILIGSLALATPTIIVAHLIYGGR